MIEESGADFTPHLSAPFYLGQETWYLQYSTRAIWQGRRNVQVRAADDQSELPLETREYTFQALDALDVKTWCDTGEPIVLHGLDGKLLSWMKVTDAGVEDDSGQSKPVELLVH